MGERVDGKGRRYESLGEADGELPDVVSFMTRQ